MKLRYELRDTHHPRWRGERRTSLDAAYKLLAGAYGDAGRWALIDRKTGETLAVSREHY